MVSYDGYGGGYGDGDGYGYGSGDGSGDGYGCGNGGGNGYGNGDGSGYGDGTGRRNGDGSGNGSGDGDGSGYGDGYDYAGNGSGDGYGDGDGSGYGDGYDYGGNGSGDGNGDGNGYGDGYGIKIWVDHDTPIMAWWRISTRLHLGKPQPTHVGAVAEWPHPVRLCSAGLHACLDKMGTRPYSNGPIVRVACSGWVQFSDNKMVCTRREIISKEEDDERVNDL